MNLFILATTVFSKVTHERRVGQGRFDSDARCYLRGESDEKQCCEKEDDDCDGCNPVLFADGIPCSEQSNYCFCDEACISFDDCCQDHNDTCAFHYEDPYEPSTTGYNPETTRYTTTSDYTSTASPLCVGFIKMPDHSYMTWKRAKRVCRLLGGQLAYFEKKEEIDTFNELEFTETSWLGMLRTKNGKNFIDVENREKIKVANWNNGEPNNANGNESCVEAYTNGKWNDINCGDWLQVTCRFEHPMYC